MVNEIYMVKDGTGTEQRLIGNGMDEVAKMRRKEDVVQKLTAILQRSTLERGLCFFEIAREAMESCLSLVGMPSLLIRYQRVSQMP